MRKKKLLILGALACTAGSLATGGTAVAQYGGGGLAVSSTVVEPGEPMTISGGGFAPNADITITLESDPVLLKRTRANATGFFTATVTIPESTPPGTHTIKASGRAAEGGQQVLSTTIVVEGEGAEGGVASALPFTGTDLLLMLVVTGGLFGVGSALWHAGRRRSRGETS